MLTHARVAPACQTHTGGSITAVHAKAQLVPHAYLRLHEELIKVRAAHARLAAESRARDPCSLLTRRRVRRSL
jgi:hypothetical protein